jgi:uncharacterized protein (TIGR03790 family)
MFNMSRIFTTVIAGLSLSYASAQLVDYNDVGVVVNSNSATSMQIGAYFMAARNIPANRLIVIDADTTANIDPIAFAPIRGQIEAHLELHQLADSLNYMVTTKGVPMRLDNGSCDSQTQISRCSSFDTELALILGPYAGGIVAQGSVPNPFAGSNIKQERATSGIYLVTRLTAPTLDDIFDLIDRSGPGIAADTSNVLLVGDVNNTDTMAGVQEFFDSVMEFVITPLANAGWNTMLDLTDNRLDSMENVLIYMGMNSPDVDWHPTHNWAPGALAMEWHVATALDQDLTGNSINQQRIARHIAGGATAALGAVGPVYGGPLSGTSTMIDRYLDTTFHFNAAEAMYAFIPSLSWTYQAVGDPKTSIVYTSNTSIADTDRSVNVVAYPNPNNGHFIISSSDPLQLYLITDMLGRTIPSASGTWSDRLSIDLSEQPEGIYVLQGSTRNGKRFTTRVVVQR